MHFNCLPQLLGLAAIVPLATATLPFTIPLNATHPVPVNISVDPAFIDETLLKAKLYRPSIDLLDDSNEAWVEGPPSANMTALRDYWVNEYDWYETEEQINANFPHFAVTIPSAGDYEHPVPLYFAHEKSSNPNAIPLLLVHGWPSTHLEWSSVIDLLVCPDDSEAQAYHVVAPDLPGFGFSPAPTHSGLNIEQLAQLLDSLMQELGYEEYGTVGTDLGWWITMWMSEVVPQSVIGHFTDFYLVGPNETDRIRYENNQTTEQETLYLQSYDAWFANHSAYATIHSQDPLRLGQALTDTPVGFAGWVWTLAQGVSDGHEYTFQEIIDRAMALFIQGVWGGIRTYLTVGPATFPKTYVPTGSAQFANARSPLADARGVHLLPQEWIERDVNLTYYSILPEGGHFPAETQPQQWVHELRNFHKTL